MTKKILLGLAVAAVAFSCRFVFCDEKDFPREKIIDIAKEAVKQAGIDLKGAYIIYDDGGKLMSQRLSFTSEEELSWKGVMKQGFLKNYRIVYFDLPNGAKDIWVCIDKDNGEVLTVYREKQ